MSQFRTALPTSDFTHHTCAQCHASIPDDAVWGCDDEPHRFCFSCVDAYLMAARNKEAPPPLSALGLCVGCHENFGPRNPVLHRSPSNSNFHNISRTISACDLRQDDLSALKPAATWTPRTGSPDWSLSCDKRTPAAARRDLAQRILVFAFSPVLLGLAIPAGLVGGGVVALRKLRRSSRGSV